MSKPIPNADQAAGAEALAKLETEFATEITELQVPTISSSALPAALEKREFSKTTKSEVTPVFLDGNPIARSNRLL